MVSAYATAIFKCRSRSIILTAIKKNHMRFIQHRLINALFRSSFIFNKKAKENFKRDEMINLCKTLIILTELFQNIYFHYFYQKYAHRDPEKVGPFSNFVFNWLRALRGININNISENSAGL